MYFPKHQYQFIDQSKLEGIENLVDQAGNSVNQSKEVVLTSSGRLFGKSGIDFEKGDFSKAKELFVKNFKEDVDPGFNSDGKEEYTSSGNQRVPSIKLIPTLSDIQKGSIKRAFYKNTSTGKIKEITPTIAIRISRRPKPYDLVYMVDWLVKGPAKDQVVNGYFYEGIESKNKKTIELIKINVPGAEQLISGPGEYVKDTLPLTSNNVQPPINTFDIPSPSKTTSIPRNINVSLNNYEEDNKVKENLFAEPGEFLIEGTMKEYTGPYHLHPTKGPMVGAKHLSTPHSRLVPRDKSTSRYGKQTQSRNTPANIPAPQSTSTRTGGESYTQTSTPSTSIQTSGGSSSGGSSSGGSSSGGSSSGY